MACFKLQQIHEYSIITPSQYADLLSFLFHFHTSKCIMFYCWVKRFSTNILQNKILWIAARISQPFLFVDKSNRFYDFSLNAQLVAVKRKWYPACNGWKAHMEPLLICSEAFAMTQTPKAWPHRGARDTANCSEWIFYLFPFLSQCQVFC